MPGLNRISLTSALMIGAALPGLAQDAAPFVLDDIVLTAEEQALQALGVSRITADDLERRPVVNDISEVVRRQPGVNLSGATATGQRGNQRQIDIRGMGPENTLILIDGRPVASRNAVRMGRGGERDTRGDAGWVPAEMIDSIEVIRGPAAARYGSGAAGGVINITTKRPEAFTGQLGVFGNAPENDKEGRSLRTNLLLGGPLGERLNFRLTGSQARTSADSFDINPVVIDPDGAERRLAGREGVVNRDLGALLSWDVTGGHRVDFESAFSRQGNLFAGDTMFGAVSGAVDLAGRETNRMYRRTQSVTHRGTYDFGESFSYLQWENTRNSRLCEGLAGGVEGAIIPCLDTTGDGVADAFEFRDITLDNLGAKSEWYLPLDLAGRRSRLTLGAEYRGEFLDDDVSIRNVLPPELGVETGVEVDPAERDPRTRQNLLGLYAEANIEWTDQLTLTPGLRFDHSSSFGQQISPSLNAAYALSDAWTVKLGAARAFKAPNLYQLNPNYVYLTRSFGCPVIDGIKLSGPCYVLGNPDLEAETSLNTEIGVAYDAGAGLAGSVTLFRNDYRNRIASGFVQENPGVVTNRLFRWENQGRAEVEGLEGNIAAPIGDRLALNANFTRIFTSRNKETGDPLSLVPDHTVNLSLDWYARPDLTVTLSATHYGRIQSAQLVPTNREPLAGTEASDPYTLVNLSASWDIAQGTRLTAGVTNIADRTVLRTNASEGANTFNEPGRAVYLGLVRSF